MRSLFAFYRWFLGWQHLLRQLRIRFQHLQRYDNTVTHVTLRRREQAVKNGTYALRLKDEAEKWFLAMDSWNWSETSAISILESSVTVNVGIALGLSGSGIGSSVSERGSSFEVCPNVKR